MRDPIVEEVRRARAKYAEKFDHDLDRMIDDLQRRQQAGEFQVIRLEPRPARKVLRPRARRSA